MGGGQPWLNTGDWSPCAHTEPSVDEHGPLFRDAELDQRL